MGIKAKRFASDFHFVEGPSFDRNGDLFVVSIQGGYISKINSRGHATKFCETGGGPNGSAFHTNGDLFVCDAKLRAILAVSPDGMFTKVVTEYEGAPLAGPNDMVFSKDGGYYFTDPVGSSREHPVGSIYRVDSDNTIRRFASGLAFPNGIALSADERRLFITETNMHRIHSYALRPDGMAAASRVHAELPPSTDGPDGMAFDIEGNLYVAMFGLGKIVMLDPWGSIKEELPAGGKNPTNVAFGGKNRQVLFITEAETNCVYTIKRAVPGLELYGERQMS